jgi:hypothetical protein
MIKKIATDDSTRKRVLLVKREKKEEEAEPVVSPTKFRIPNITLLNPLQKSMTMMGKKRKVSFGASPTEIMKPDSRPVTSKVKIDKEHEKIVDEFFESLTAKKEHIKDK